MDQHRSDCSGGFTLIELMIAVAILAIISAIAIPAYRGYIAESRLGAMRMNLDTLRVAIEAFRLDDASGSYGAVGKLDLAAIDTRYGWKPEGDSGAYSYVADITGTATYRICAASNVGASMTCVKSATGFGCTPGTAATVTTGSGCP
jgi:type IV pilus assembly protein PilE